MKPTPQPVTNQSTVTIRGTIMGLARIANPAFALAAVAIPLAALVYVLAFGTIREHTFVHVMAGILWTGIDIFMATVIGPVLGGVDHEAQARVFGRLTPKMAFLLPTLAVVTIFGGITLAQRLGYFPHSGPWIALFTAFTMIPAFALMGQQFKAFGDWRWQLAFAIVTIPSLVWVALTIGHIQMIPFDILLALIVVAILSVQGFGLLMPGEVRIFLEMNSPKPDASVISATGQRNAKLAGIQGFFQLVLIVVMVYIRWGGFGHGL